MAKVHHWLLEPRQIMLNFGDTLQGLKVDHLNDGLKTLKYESPRKVFEPDVPLRE